MSKITREAALDNTRKLIMKELESLDSYEARHKFLSTGTITSPKGKQLSIKKMVSYFPEFQQDVNDYMLGVAIGETGNPEDPAYTFSKKVSDEALLETFDRLYPGGEPLGGSLKETKSQYEQEYLDESGDWVAQDADLKERKSNLQKSITAQRDKFDERATFFPSGIPIFPWWARDESVPDDAAIKDKYDWDPVELSLPYSGLATEKAGIVGYLADSLLGATMPVAAGLTQLMAGWTDWGREKGMEKVENRRFMYDPGVKDESGEYVIEPGYGIPDKIRATQDKLASVLGAIDELGAQSDYGIELKKRNKAFDDDMKVYTESILDDLIEDGYSDPLQILDKLKEGSKATY